MSDKKATGSSSEERLRALGEEIAASQRRPEAAQEAAPEAAQETAPEAAQETAPEAAQEAAPEAAQEEAATDGRARGARGRDPTIDVPAWSA